VRPIYDVVNNGNGRQRCYFICLNRLNDRTCGLRYLAADDVEQAVGECRLKNQMPPERLDAFSAYPTDRMEASAKENEKEVVLLNRRIAKVKAERVKSAMNETILVDTSRPSWLQLLELEQARDKSASLASGQADDCQRVLAFVRDGAGDHASSSRNRS
jgi:hypothetical protein